MISKKINNVRKKMRSVSESKKNQYKQKEEAKKNKAFFDAYDTLTKDLISIKLGKEQVNFNISEAAKLEVNEILEEVKKIFEKKYVSNPYEISKKIDNLNFHLKTEWDECAKEKLGIKSNIELMILISDNKSLSGISFELGAIREWPVTEKSIERYSKAYDRATQVINEYNFNDEVSAFLRKVRNGTATFRDLTEGVQKWIVEEHLEDKIRLSIVS